MARFSAPGVQSLSSRFSALSAPGTEPTPNGFSPTSEQDAVLEAAKQDRVLVVEALAGTGKTSTLKLLANTRPGTSAVYLAYNRSVALEAKRSFPGWVHVATAHSLAYQAIGHAYGHRLPGKGSTSRRMFARDLARLLGIKGGQVGDRQLSGTHATRLAEATVKQFCLSADRQVLASHIPAHALQLYSDGKQLADVVLPAARRIWDDIRNTQGKSYFTHDHYLKIWQTMDPKLPVDCVMFDEAQDANPPVAAIVGAQEHAQCVYVGDQNQQMYAWRGATDAMSKVQGTRLALTKSFRFGHRIAEEANTWLDLLGSPHRVVGHDPINSQVGPIAGVPDALLCRTNGGALSAILDYQANGVKVAMAPGDSSAGRDLMSFAYAARNLMAGKTTDHPDLVAFENWAEVLEYAEKEEGGSDLGRLIAITSRIGPAGVISAVRNLVPGKDSEVMVSTAHKAKGLEWDRVRICSDFTRPEDPDNGYLPKELSKLDLRAAQMVAYVSVTRAKRQLDTGPLNVSDWMN